MRTILPNSQYATVKNILKPPAPVTTKKICNVDGTIKKLTFPLLHRQRNILKIHVQRLRNMKRIHQLLIHISQTFQQINRYKIKSLKDYEWFIVNFSHLSSDLLQKKSKIAEND